jgi:acetyl coenzyme A synthetase (ADP forming)-like protein
MSSSLLPFFKPRGVAVVGVSTSPEKLGYGVARNLVQSGYQGAIHFVSQKQGGLFGRPLHTSLSEVPDPVDLAILIVPANAAAESIQACGRRGIQAAIIVSAGFREIGPEGAELERQCLEIARSYQIRLLGPNCIGMLDTHLPLDTTFLPPPMPTQGGIAFISHSGAFCAAIVDWARQQGFGFSQLISLGNQVDVTETDVLPVVAQDEHTHVIVLYMESVSDGRRFVQTASEVTRHKPVIALKVGRFESGQKAAASHTGALAASDTAFEAAFEKAGIFRAETAEQIFDWARALEDCPLPRGRRMAVLTNAGGPGVIAADSLETQGLLLAQMDESTREALSANLPASASVQNPIDMLASASPETFATCLRILLEDEGVDGIMVILPPPPMYKAEDVAEKLIQVSRQFDKPVLVALMGSTLIEKARSIFEQSKIPTYPFPERAASALGILARRAEFLATKRTESFEKKFSTNFVADPIELLAGYGIQTAPVRLARDADECASIAKELGFPVVLKIASPDIMHKSDVGGVVLDIKSKAKAKSGYLQLVGHVGRFNPGGKIQGVHVQRQVPPGQEVIVGAVRDPQFGPLMMFGSGGVEVEGLKDVAFALAPLSRVEAADMLRKTWAGKKLKGFRNLPPADEESVMQVLIRLSRLVHEHAEIEEIEINPLRVLSQGAVALDVRVKTKPG